MKLTFTYLLIFFSLQSAYCQNGYTIHLLVPAGNIKAMAKMPVMINENKFLMKQGSFATLHLYADTAKFSFCSTDWHSKKGTTMFSMDKDIFVVAFYDATASGTNKYFFREVRLETFYQLKTQCKREAYASN